MPYIMKTCPCPIPIFLKLYVFDIFLIFAQNIDCGYPQSMFWSKNKKKICIPLHITVLLYKSGVQGDIPVHVTDMFS